MIREKIRKAYRRTESWILRRYFKGAHVMRHHPVVKKVGALPVAVKAGVGVLAIFAAIVALLPLYSTQATPKVLTVQREDLLDGTREYGEVAINNEGESLQLQSGVVGHWDETSTVQNLELPVVGDMVMAYGPNHTLYTMTPYNGYGMNCNFTVYSIETKKRHDLPPPPVACSTGAQLIYDRQGALYYFPGESSAGAGSRLFKYDIGSQTWTARADVPGPIFTKSSAAFVQQGAKDYLYLFRSSTSPSFYRYDVDANTWLSLPPFPATKSNNGVVVTWDGRYTLYALAHSSGEFKKYDLVTQTWSDLPDYVSAGYINFELFYQGDKVMVKGHHTISYSVALSTYTPSTSAWTSKDVLPILQTQASARPFIGDGEKYVYTVGSYGSYAEVFRYDTIADTWNAESMFRRAAGELIGASGGSIMYDGNDSLYYAGAASTGQTLNANRMFKKDLTSGVVSELGGGTSPSGFYGTYRQESLYLVSPGSQLFHRYDLATESYMPLANIGYNAGYGGSLIDGDDGYLYFIRGGAGLNFSRYNISSNTWSQLASPPAEYATYIGGGAARVGRTVYLVAGYKGSAFYKYNMDTNVWSEATKMPVGNTYYGSFLTSDSTRYLYAGLSNGRIETDRFLYRYDTTAEQWTRVSDLPAGAKMYASAAYDTKRNRLLVNKGFKEAILWSWNPQQGDSEQFVKSGTWYSKEYDLKQVASWGDIDATVEGVSGDSQAVIYTRSSANKSLWSSWQPLAGKRITSPEQRYMQFKVVLSGTGASTPTISNISINYTQETTPPGLPSQLNAYSKEDKEEALTSGSTYTHLHPYFTWSGASDGVNGSGIDGYYVYFGKDSSADPKTEGSYHKEAAYTVSTPMTAGEVYYLRIKAVDGLGNSSAASTYFSYRYSYISPPGSILKTTSSDFSNGQNSGVVIRDDAMKLTQREHGGWATGVSPVIPFDTSNLVFVATENELYVLADAALYRYDIISGIWQRLVEISDTVGEGASIVHAGEDLYFMTGGSSANIYRYSIQDGEVGISNSALPAQPKAGSSMVYIGKQRLAIAFAQTKEIYIYDITQKTYTLLPEYSVITANGAGFWYDGKETLYAHFGYVNGPRNVAAYNLTSDTWRDISSAPSMPFGVQGNLVGDGSGDLYVLSTDTVFYTSSRRHLMKYSSATDSWSEISGLSDAMINSRMASDGKRYIYILPRMTEPLKRIIRYDTWNNTFGSLSDAIAPSKLIQDISTTNILPWQAGYTQSAVYDGSTYIYAITGLETVRNAPSFVRYNYKEKTTEYLAAPPMTGGGGSIQILDGRIYYAPSRASSHFFRYSVADNNWTRMADIPTSVARSGASSLVAAGGSLYLPAGSVSNKFYRYTPNASGGIWQEMAEIQTPVYDGSMVYDKSRNSIYYILSGGRALHKYSIDTNTWDTSLALAPDNNHSGSVLLLNKDALYILRGGTKDSFVYDIPSNTWKVGSQSPVVLQRGSIGIGLNETTALIMPNQGANIWSFQFPSSDISHEGSATHISEVMETNGIYDYANFSLGVTLPKNTGVEVYTRTSEDGQVWDDWTVITDKKQSTSRIDGIVRSKPARYIQAKIILESYDNIYSPTVSDYQLSYYYDLDPPANPSAFTAYDSKDKVKIMTSSEWYNSSQPLFDWPDPGEPGGANDGTLGSSIAGYWVYVGKDTTAHPRTQGVFVKESQYIPQLTEAGLYHVRIQAQDMTGNLDAAIFAPFTYRFDNVPPTAPTFITVTPSGFNARNNYSFSWPSAFDSHSGIAGYCYYTGATSGPFAVEKCQTGTSLNDISAAYRNGTNVFYLRTYDVAGNYSPSYTTVSYYYSTDAPSAATNLRAIPPTSEQNMFAFSWDLPQTYSGDPSQLSYCYSINVLPTPTNTTCTFDRFLPAFKAATQRGTNILYIVAMDEAKNVNWNNFATANFIANTVSPGIPLGLLIADTSDRIAGRWALTLTWDPPIFVGNGIKDYVVERSTDGHTFTAIGNTSNRAYVDLSIEPEVQYYYRVRAQDNVNNIGGSSGAVSKMAKGLFTTPPEIVIAPTAQSDFSQAQVKWATSRPSAGFVYYGTSPSALTSNTGSISATTNHEHTLTGLSPQTTYYYRVQSFDEQRGYEIDDAYSEIYSFTTTAASQIKNVRISDITFDSAVVTWDTSAPATSTISYGESLGYEAGNTDSATTGTVHTQRLRGLKSGARYNFKITSVTGFGGKIMSDNYTFTTIAKPEVRDVRFQPVEDGASAGVLVTWLTNVPTSSTVRYSAHGSSLEQSNSELSTSHEVLIKDLASNTEYEIYVEGRDEYGNLATSQKNRWTSSLDTRSPKVDNVVHNVTTTGVGKNKKAQVIVTWTTDEPSVSQVIYSSIAKGSVEARTPLNTEATTNHVAILSDLSLASIYRIQVTSRDLTGNTSYGKRATVVTPDREVNVIDSVLDLLLRMFRVL